VATRVRAHLRSNLVGYLALFVALGGVAYAGAQIPGNSIGSPQLRPLAVKNSDLGNAAVTNSKLAPHAVTGSKVAVGSLTGASLAPKSLTGESVADRAITSPKLDVPAKFVDAGLPEAPNSSCNYVATAGWYGISSLGFQPVAYWIDPFGIVHLQGAALRCLEATGPVFTLPAGARPGGAETYMSANPFKPPTPVGVVVEADGDVQASPGNNNPVSLAGITFRCAPSGQDGCP
jgi:hypothetical protein